ncbi:MAG: DegT/DnrJ/EryC1/StrS family aminotransferase [Sulfuricurvum sp.]|jgi:dTDP-4-amino-4,6-dideoxygalactose transaminase
MAHTINWWRTDFIEDEIEHIAASIRNKCVSQGKVTEEFENKICELLGVEHTICVSSGSVALLASLMAAGVQCGDEVIVPNRTWIATAHAVHILGAKPIFVDVEENRPIIDSSKIEEKITKKTKAIMPVALNGRSPNMREINRIAKKYNLFVIEDAAQAIYSRNTDGYLGTQSDMGCFSLSVAKAINTGQGGFVVTNNYELANRLRAIRTHGVENVKDPNSWVMPGFNFRYTDVLASIGLEQLKRIDAKVNHIKTIYSMYEEGLKSTPLNLIKVDIEGGEIPVYNEFLVDHRDTFIRKLEEKGIETRPFYPNMNDAIYFKQQSLSFPNSLKYGSNGVYLPSGPNQPLENIEYVIKTIKNI